VDMLGWCMLAISFLISQISTPLRRTSRGTWARSY
jgi:hypothetical protein